MQSVVVTLTMTGLFTCFHFPLIPLKLQLCFTVTIFGYPMEILILFSVLKSATAPGRGFAQSSPDSASTCNFLVKDLAANAVF